LQRTTQLCFAAAPFRKMIELICSDQKYVLRFRKEAVEALMEGYEAYQITMLEKASLLTIFAKRVTMQRKDYEMVLRVTDDKLEKLQMQRPVQRPTENQPRRRNQSVKNAFDRLCKPAILRMCRRAGYRRVSSDVYPLIREENIRYLETLLFSIDILVAHDRKKTVDVKHVLRALKRINQTLYV
jgi:histone H3/H4